MSEHELRAEVMELRERNSTLLVVLRLVVVLVKVCDVSLVRRSVPQSEKKRLLLRAVDSSRQALSFRSALRVSPSSRGARASRAVDLIGSRSPSYPALRIGKGPRQ